MITCLRSRRRRSQASESRLRFGITSRRCFHRLPAKEIVLASGSEYHGTGEARAILVPRDDTGCSSANGQFQELVVLRIATFSDDLGHFNLFGVSHHSCEKLKSLFLFNELVELWSSQHVIQLGDRCQGNKQLSLSRGVECLPRYGPRKQYGADDHACIDDGSRFIHREAAIREVPESTREFRLPGRFHP